jgi:hypothetical protein
MRPARLHGPQRHVQRVQQKSVQQLLAKEGPDKKGNRLPLVLVIIIVIRVSSR